MFDKKENPNILDVPPIAKSNPNSIEILRVWAAPGETQQLTLRTVWEDVGAWGIMLVDIARHVAKAYEHEGKDPNATLARIHELFISEWNNPTDEPKEIHR
jgi:hypothetical protein